MSWALWQRLPPRYQLTAKDVTDDSDSAPSTPRSPRAQRSRTPRSAGANPRSKAKDSLNSKGQGQATMYFTVTSPRDIHSSQEAVSPQPAFPMRRSPFINNFKQQQRINSARQQFQDPSTATPKARSHVSPRRARTAPQFPITHLETHETQSARSSPKSMSIDMGVPSTPVAKKAPRLRVQPKSAGATRQSQLSVNTIVPFDQTKPFLKNPLYPEQKNKRFVLRNFDNGTMFIDNDKVVFIKKGKNGQSVFSSQDESAGYIAHLRKLYLTQPKDFAKRAKPHESAQEKKKLIRERLEYDKRTDHILDYYKRGDDIQTARAWTHGVERSYRQNTPASARASSSRERRRAFSPTSPRRSSARTRPNSARYYHQQQQQQQPAEQSVSDALSDWNVFVKINSRSTLHERRFYLQTPANRPPAPEAEKDCSCRLCRLEMEMALLRQQHGDHIVLLPQAHTTDELPSDQGIIPETEHLRTPVANIPIGEEYEENDAQRHTINNDDDDGNANVEETSCQDEANHLHDIARDVQEVDAENANDAVLATQPFSSQDAMPTMLSEVSENPQEIQVDHEAKNLPDRQNEDSLSLEPVNDKTLIPSSTKEEDSKADAVGPENTVCESPSKSNHSSDIEPQKSDEPTVQQKLQSDENTALHTVLPQEEAFTVISSSDNDVSSSSDAATLNHDNAMPVIESDATSKRECEENKYTGAIPIITLSECSSNAEATDDDPQDLVEPDENVSHSAVEEKLQETDEMPLIETAGPGQESDADNPETDSDLQLESASKSEHQSSAADHQLTMDSRSEVILAT